MSFAVNQVIGNYECLGIIDKPKAGVTYKVRNLATGEIELLRALPGASSRDPESVERLLREIRIQTRLSHPNIVEFHDAFEIDGCLVMTTEFLEAPTLAELCRGGALPPGKAIGAITQVLEGLEQAHALGIVHRGITAEHVTITRDGAVKVSGFDLAKPASDTNLTRMGTVAGDPRYLSPEQVIGQAALDARSDLYSAGVLLYLTLTGKVPFDAKNDADVLAAQVRSEPLRPSIVNPTISPELDRIVLTALKKDPNQRFASAREFRIALAAVEIIQRPAQAVVSTPNLLSLDSKMQHNPRRPLTVPVVFGLLVVTIAAAIIVWLATH
jgi:serine/threonine-protein kinase